LWLREDSPDPEFRNRYRSPPKTLLELLWRLASKAQKTETKWAASNEEGARVEVKAQELGPLWAQVMARKRKVG